MIIINISDINVDNVKHYITTKHLKESNSWQVILNLPIKIKFCIILKMNLKQNSLKKLNMI